MRSAIRWCVLFAMVAIAGCATAPRSTNTTPTRSAAELQRWQASGRIAVAGVDSGGSGSFTWIQQGGDADVRMHGPIGIGSLELKFGDRGVHIKNADGQEFDAEDAEAELTNRLGASVPIRNLRFWIVGIAAPGEHEWSNAADSATLLQDNWRIDYQHFVVVDGVRLPAKLVAVSGSAKVRILVDRWRLAP